MADTYKITIAGLERELPLCKISDKLTIAAFVIFGDVEITVAAASELLKKVPEFDYIVTPEAKSIPLAYEMARQSGKPYFVARKGLKGYMKEPFHIEVKSITTSKVQTLYMDATEGRQLTGKKVLIVDDVISTGESLLSLTALLNNFDCEIVGKTAVLAEGDAAERDDIIFLEAIPLFIEQ